MLRNRFLYCVSFLFVLAMSQIGYAVTGNGEVDEASGSWNYTLPFEVPAFRGVEPKLALKYSSSSPNGLAGMGWSLAGFSEITLSPSDAVVGHNVYYLDGQKLIECTSGTISPSCQNGGTHATQIESYLRIRYDSSKNYWYVTRPDGTLLAYEQQERNSVGRIAAWGLSKVTDTSGNSAKYDWACFGGVANTGHCYPSKVSYNTVYPTSINFGYEERPDPVARQYVGAIDTLQLRMAWVAVWVNHQVLRSYKFEYGSSPSTQRSLLIKASERGAAGTLLNSAVFTYAPSSIGMIRPSILANLDDSQDPYRSPTALPSSAYAQSPAGSPVDFIDRQDPSHGYDTGARAISIDGTGSQQILEPIPGRKPRVWVFKQATMRSELSGWAVNKSLGDILPSNINDSLQTTREFLADVDGDGLTDVFSSGTMVLSAGASRRFKTAVKMPYIRDNKVCAFVDLTGDGRADYVCKWSDSEAKIWYYRDQNLIPMSPSFDFPISDLSTKSFYRYADLNGDGLTDLLTCVRSGKNNKVETRGAFLNTGAGFVFAPHFVPPVCFTTPNDSRRDSGVRVVDLNGDGLSDLVQSYTGSGYYSGNSVTSPESAWLNSGKGWISTPLPGSFQISVDHAGGDAGARFIDANGDGSVDVVLGRRGKPPLITSRGLLLSVSGIPDVMTQATNGNGGSWVIEYKPSSVWPNSQMAKVISTVATVKANDGLGTTGTTSYSYSGALFDNVELRFLGFAYTKKILPCSDAACPYQETWFLQDYGSATKPKDIVYRDAIGNILLRKMITYVTNGPAPYTSLPSVETSYVYKDKTNAAGSRIQRYYDEFGNNIAEYRDNDISISGDETVTYVQYVKNTQSYLVKFPGQVLTYAGSSNAGPTIAKTFYYYDGADSYQASPTRGLLTKERRWLDVHDTYVEKRMEFDSAGQLSRSFNENNEMTQYVRPDALYVSTVIDALGASDPRHQQTTTWDTQCGKPRTTTGLNRDTTSYTYDEFCRLQTMQMPLGNFVNASYTYYNSPLLGQYVQVRKETSSPNVGVNRWVLEKYDGFGRLVKKESNSADGKSIIEESQYDVAGRLKKQSSPYFSNDPPQWTAYQYDMMGRPITVTYPGGGSASWRYGFFETTMTDEHGGMHEQIFDTQGRMVGTSDAIAGKWYGLSHEYDLRGHIIQATDYDGNVWTHQFDSLGREIHLEDPDMGVWDFVYDAKGQLISKTDAKAQVTCYEYDDLGRMLSQTALCGTAAPQVTSWRFDEFADGYATLGRLTTATNAAEKIHYIYNKSGNVIGTYYTIDGKEFFVGTRYDGSGHLRSITYPDREVLGTSDTPIQYDSTEQLFSLPGIAHSLRYNAAGQLVSRTNDNGTVVSQSFSVERGFLLNKHAVGHDVVQDLSFKYLSGGFLQSVTSNVADQSWQFQYDTIGQLTQASSSLRTEAYVYTSSGNMTQYNATTMQYPFSGASRPHAAQTVSGDAYQYDANGNLVSGGGRSIEWNAENQAVRINNSYFAYGPDGRRVKKIENGKTTYYIGDSIEETDGVLTKYFNVGGELIAKKVGQTKYWLYTDHLGSVQAIEGVNGNVQRQSFTPFGIPTGGMIAGETRGFTGQRHDATGLIYLNSRYYDPAIGRFISPDTVVPTGSPIGLNRYAYAYNTPTMFTDPSGHMPWLALLFGVPGAALGPVGWAVLGVTTAAMVGYGIYEAYAAGDFRSPSQFFSSGGGSSSGGNRSDTHGTVHSYAPGGGYVQGTNGAPAQLWNANTQRLMQEDRPIETSFFQPGDFLNLAGDLWSLGSSIFRCITSESLEIVAQKAATEAAETGAARAGNAIKLGKELASKQQVDQLATDTAEIIAGSGNNKALRDVSRLVSEYGGQPSDWQKVSSSSYRSADGFSFETHGYRNIRTKKVVEPKTKFWW
jgi:RHS repeat-associated protein